MLYLLLVWCIMKIVFNLAKLFLNEFARFSEESQIVPNGDERETHEKAKGASKISHQGGDRIDQLLGLDCRLLRAELQNILHLDIWRHLEIFLQLFLCNNFVHKVRVVLSVRD